MRTNIPPSVKENIMLKKTTLALVTLVGLGFVAKLILKTNVES